jgi:beta-fructofuranosidase
VVFIPEEHYLWDFWLVSPREWRDQHALYHLFYLQAPRSLHDPNLRHGMATVGHAVSSDLLHWVHRGTVLKAGAPGSWDDRAIWTGSVTIHDGLAYIFYTALSNAEQVPFQRIGLATSVNLTHWQRHPNNPLLEVDTRWYERQSTEPGGIQTWRDPYVVYASDEQVYYMFLSARVNTGSHDGRAVIGLARSTDLLSWELLPPVSIPGDFTEMEVPQVVPLNGRYYLLFCASGHAASRLSRMDDRRWTGTHYLVSNRLTGPYLPLTDEPLVADATGTYYAGKLVLDSAGTPFFMAWRQWDEAGNFCGGLSDPAAVAVLPDGRLRVHTQQLWTTGDHRDSALHS